MGLNIREIIPRKEIEISDLKGKTLCVDAFNVLYQFLSTIRQYDGAPLMDSQDRITSHLSGIFYRNISLLNEGMKLVYVFDGDAPELKAKTWKKRSDVREKAKEKYEEAKKEEDYSSMRKYSSQLLRLDEEMVAESKELLEAMGIAIVQAPSEGEAQAAYLAKNNNEIFASVSQDYDSLLFGAPRLIRNLTISRKKKNYTGGYTEVPIESIELEKVLNYLEIDLDGLICLGILVGTDYNPKGVPRIGQKKALELVQRFKQPVLIFNAVEDKIKALPKEDQFDWKEIFALFRNHNVSKEKIVFPKINVEKVKEILVQKHEFSGDRITNSLEKLQKIVEKNKQKDLNQWF